MKLNKIMLLLPFLIVILAITSAFSCIKLKTPIDYGESKWISDENALIKIEMLVSDNREAYSFVTYNEVTKKYENRFISEMIYFNNIDEDGNLILEDGHVTGFSVWLDGSSNGVIKCRMDLNKFMADFFGSNDTQYENEYFFVLSIV